jgi:hypothetical protein
MEDEGKKGKSLGERKNWKKRRYGEEKRGEETTGEEKKWRGTWKSREEENSEDRKRGRLNAEREE